MVRSLIAARVVGLLFLLSVAAAAAHAEVRANVSYGPDPVQKLDLCLPSAKGSGLRPAVIMIHGGYWVSGSKETHAQLCKEAASQGIVAATVDYRLADGTERHRWPAQLVDAQLAVRWLRSRAAELDVDPARICALGDSAGAHLAVFLTVLDRAVPGDYAGEIPSASSAVACAVDNFGPVDLSAEDIWPPNQQLFGIEGRSPAQERDASPLFRVGRATAPIMIVQGRDDKAVSADQSSRLYARLNSARVPARMVVLNCGHEFAGLSWPEIRKVLQSELDYIKSAPARGRSP